jgi:opine dehydrogenase
MIEEAAHMSNPVSVAVLGAGNGAFAVAADLKLKGCRVQLLEAPEFAGNLELVQEKGGIELINEDVPGVASGLAQLDAVTTDPGEALDGAQIVLYVVPAFAERRFTQLCAPYFRPSQLVVLFCGNFGGALELAHHLRSGGAKSLPFLAETEGLIYGASKLDPARVKVVGLKKGLVCAALPATDTEGVLSRLRSLFPELLPAANVLETGLRNLNPVIHPVVSVLNAGRTAKDRPQWRYYWEGVTEAVGRVAERVDRERLQLAQSLSLSVPPALEVLHVWYARQEIRWSNLAEALSTNPVYKGLWAPHTLHHRFLLEDVPFGLVPIESLASSAGIATPAISSLINLSSELLGADFRAEGRDLSRLGLIGLAAGEIERLVGMHN